MDGLNNKQWKCSLTKNYLNHFKLNNSLNLSFGLKAGYYLSVSFFPSPESGQILSVQP